MRIKSKVQSVELTVTTIVCRKKEKSSSYSCPVPFRPSGVYHRVGQDDPLGGRTEVETYASLLAFDFSTISIWKVTPPITVSHRSYLSTVLNPCSTRPFSRSLTLVVYCNESPRVHLCRLFEVCRYKSHNKDMKDTPF